MHNNLPPEAFRADPVDDFEHDMQRAEVNVILVSICVVAGCAAVIVGVVFWL